MDNMNDINWPEVMVGAVIGLILGSFFTDILKNVMTRFVYSVANIKVRKIGGTWKSTWSYIVESGEEKVFDEQVELVQYGSRVKGGNDGKTHQYSLSGNLRNEIYLTGVWKEVRKEQIYHGAFQLMVSPNGKKMDGIWVGFSASGIIRSGKWTLEKIG